VIVIKSSNIHIGFAHIDRPK